MTYFVILLALSIAPAILLMKMIASKQAYELNRKLTKKIFLFGFLTIIPIIIIELIMEGLNPFATDTLRGILIDNIVCVAMVEEAVKLFLVMMLTKKLVAVHDKYDWMVWCTASSLGFALIENVMYVMTSESGIAVGIMRMFLSVPSHMSYGIIMGLFWGLYKQYEEAGYRARGSMYVVLAFVVPVILHGVNNAMLDLDMVFMSVLNDIIVVTISLIIWKRVKRQAVNARWFRENGINVNQDNINMFAARSV